MSKITYSIITALVAFAVYALYIFFTSGSPQTSTELYILGFIALLLAFILIPTKPSYTGYRNGLRARWYNFNRK
ncbi:hypothetical protein [Pedobacter zeae]|uniref:Membrane associated rhomboid family serine protease n=1 Tax=Pedobacter zeae TaxID=1737356 RepID=A0A7W6KBC3_9SPHI|nr:hypothetical protein [Pedobacter zeae]MBB4107731.1 membrane associated rhomboid family serine protease [Pedobacter zeae]GGG97428.1 hypothetical protein GCM10007422_09230 [Pedobacter zeae]